MAGSPAGQAHAITPTGRLPVMGSLEIPLPVEELWDVFCDVEGWSTWNPCIWRARMLGGPLRERGTLVWAFNPIEPRYLYKLPALATIVELRPRERVTWEVSLPGLHAVHSFTFERVDERRCRFGSWETAEGALYRACRRFWDAHFRFVCETSLRGAAMLGQRARYTRPSVDPKNSK
jgi:polyketide cyclase/dehydrase/lipid transport protein